MKKSLAQSFVVVMLPLSATPYAAAADKPLQRSQTSAVTASVVPAKP